MAQRAPILVTGAAGFIGMHTCLKLLEAGEKVVGMDNFSPYYDPAFKEARARLLARNSDFKLFRGDLADLSTTQKVFRDHGFRRVIHLAAQPGIRYSLENPHAYVQSNVVAFVNLLEACRASKLEHLVYASSSSVYGSNTHVPFSVHDNVDHPISLYAATKKSNELLAHTYSHLFSLPTTGLRFFTVYGPWGRPDMAPMIFMRKLVKGEPIDVFNHGDLARDFTYVDDVAQGVVAALDKIPKPDPSFDRAHPDPARSHAPYRIYNIGNHQPVNLLEFVSTLERVSGKKATLNLLPMQPGDVQSTFADIGDLKRDVGFAPSTPLESGLRRTFEWFKEYSAQS